MASRTGLPTKCKCPACKKRGQVKLLGYTENFDFLACFACLCYIRDSEGHGQEEHLEQIAGPLPENMEWI